MSKTYQAFVRVKGTQDWKSVPYGDQTFVADEQGVGAMQQMVHIMTQNFPLNEYSIMEVTL